jgi:hypothetical protein
MCLPNIRRLSTEVLNAIAIPMMPCPSNKIARILITAYPWLWSEVRVVAEIQPDIGVAVDQCKIRHLYVPAAVLIVVV